MNEQERIARLERLLHRAYDAMWNWHEVHGYPDAYPARTREEDAMGAACRAIDEELNVPKRRNAA